MRGAKAADRAQRRGIPALVLLALGLASPLAAHAAGFEPIALETTPIAAFLPGEGDRFGSLAFRGGLVLRSSAAEFGGLSGIDFSGDGTTLYGVTDTGFWFAAEPVQEAGWLMGLRNARMAPILNTVGTPVRGKSGGDAEALRIVPAGDRDAALVAFEQGHPVRRFDAAPEFAGATALREPLLTAAGGAENRGFEALAVAPPGAPLAGATVLVAERSLDANGNHRGWIVGGPRPGAFSIRRYGVFDITDAAFLPDGDLLLLERSFSLPGGLAMRMRRIPAGDLAPGRTTDGVFLIEADMGYEIDNMEGLAVRRSAAGETLIMIVSDDNHNPLERTVLLQFVLDEAQLPTPRLRPRRRAASGS